MLAFAQTFLLIFFNFHVNTPRISPLWILFLLTTRKNEHLSAKWLCHFISLFLPKKALLISTPNNNNSSTLFLLFVFSSEIWSFCVSTQTTPLSVHFTIFSTRASPLHSPHYSPLSFLSSQATLCIIPYQIASSLSSRRSKATTQNPVTSEKKKTKEGKHKKIIIANRP